MVKQLERQCKNTKIYYRILPMMKMCWEYVKILGDKKTLYVRYLQDFRKGEEICKPSYWSFETDGIFYNNTQTEIYESIVPDLLKNVLKGQNGIILCFGQTGTGKSLTSIGIENSYEDRGIIPRLISDLFIIKNESRRKLKMTFNLSYVESTKTNIKDLLTEEGRTLDMNSLKEVTLLKCSNERDMLKAIFKAEGRKTLTKTSKYMSHAANSVLSISITSTQIQESSLIKTFCKIHVVDLAGADNYGNKPSFDKDITEVATANLAKTQLEQFLLVLTDNIPEHILVKQRLNVLINYLKDSLNGNSMLRFIGHVRTDKENLLITLSMLRFGQIFRGLRTRRLHYNNYEDEETKIKNLEIKLKELKTEKEIDSMIRNEDLRSNLTQERISHIKSVAEDYLQKKTDVLTVVNLADINIVLEVFKTMFTTLENDKVIALETVYKRAYDDAVASLKNSCRSIGSQRSSRRANQSKESLPSSARQLRSNKKSVPFSRSISKNSKHVEKSATGSKIENLSPKSRDSLLTDKSLRRSQTNSKILKKSISGKRKSSWSSDNQRERILEEDLLLPDNMPSYTEAWNCFVASEQYCYDELKTRLDEFERETKRLNRQYVDEVRKLQELRNRQDDCQNKLLQTQMQQELYGGVENNEDGEPYVSEQEAICTEVLNGLRKQVAQQQERVLSMQTELYLYLQLYQEKRKTINENFEAFCNEKYKTLVPNIEETSETNIHKVYSPYKNSEEELSKQEQLNSIRRDTEAKRCHELFMQYEKLKTLTNKQRDKMFNNQLLNKKWIRSCKN